MPTSPKKTKTSSFGSPGRIGHDSSAFYAGRLYADQPQEEMLEYVENRIPSDKLDRIVNASAERMADLPDSSVHLMVTSPPYNVGKDYDEDLSLEEYLHPETRLGRDSSACSCPAAACA